MRGEASRHVGRGHSVPAHLFRNPGDGPVVDEVQERSRRHPHRLEDLAIRPLHLQGFNEQSFMDFLGIRLLRSDPQGVPQLAMAKTPFSKIL